MKSCRLINSNAAGPVARKNGDREMVARERIELSTPGL
jgi:hypothetical protein